MLRQILPFGLALLLLMGTAVAATEAVNPLPLSCFVIHCEPTKASEASFLALTDLVEQATAAAVPLTIDFTAQWAEMILASEEKLSAVTQWLADGHEIGCHHHPYWSTQSRTATWDGYTDTPASEIDPAESFRYRGTMADYMALLDALPGERITACMGLEDERDAIDWPCQIVYSTVGQSIDDAVSTPYESVLNECSSWQVTHSLLLAQEPGALQALYRATPSTSVFCVVGHVYNFVEDPQPFVVWLGFLAGSDAEAVYRGTVSQIIERWFLENPS